MKPFFNFVEKSSFSFKPVKFLVTTTGAGKQAPMVLEQVKGNNKPQEMDFYCLYSKKAT